MILSSKGAQKRQTSGLTRNHVNQMALLRANVKLLIMFSKRDRKRMKERSLCVAAHQQTQFYNEEEMLTGQLTHPC